MREFRIESASATWHACESRWAGGTDEHDDRRHALVVQIRRHVMRSFTAQCCDHARRVAVVREMWFVSPGRNEAGAVALKVVLGKVN